MADINEIREISRLIRKAIRRLRKRQIPEGLSPTRTAFMFRIGNILGWSIYGKAWGRRRYRYLQVWFLGREPSFVLNVRWAPIWDELGGLKDSAWKSEQELRKIVRQELRQDKDFANPVVYNPRDPKGFTFQLALYFFLLRELSPSDLITLFLDYVMSHKLLPKEVWQQIELEGIRKRESVTFKALCETLSRFVEAFADRYMPFGFQDFRSLLKLYLKDFMERRSFKLPPWKLAGIPRSTFYRHAKQHGKKGALDAIRERREQRKLYREYVELIAKERKISRKSAQRRLQRYRAQGKYPPELEEIPEEKDIASEALQMMDYLPQEEADRMEEEFWGRDYALTSKEAGWAAQQGLTIINLGNDG